MAAGLPLALLFTDVPTLRKIWLRGIEGMNDPVDILRRWHGAIQRARLRCGRSVLADDATYAVAFKVGALRGRAQIVKAFRDYFAEYPDQVAVDDSFEKVSPAAAKSTWHPPAAPARRPARSSSAGAKETIYLNAEGKIEERVGGPTYDQQPGGNQAPARSMPRRAMRRSSSIWVRPPLRS